LRGLGAPKRINPGRLQLAFEMFRLSGLVARAASTRSELEKKYLAPKQVEKNCNPLAIVNALRLD